MTMSLRDSFLAAIVLSVLMFWGAGCIPVDDLGGYWDKGIIDVIGQSKGGLRNEGDGP